MHYTAAIFDMDGLLLDTEKICQNAFREACQYLALPMLEDVYLGIIGCNYEGIKQVICKGYGESLDYDILRYEWMKRYHRIVYHQAIPVKLGVIALLDWLQAQSIPMAIATSTDKKLSKIKLQRAGLLHYFTCFSNGCEVKKGKPDPEIFLLAAKRLNVSPCECIVFEDSSNGVRSAISAGMQVYQVPDLVEPNAGIRALGQKISTSLVEVLCHLQCSKL